MNKIIYKNTDNSVDVLIPAQPVLDVVGLKAIAGKDVPQGLPYWLASESDIPSDRGQRNAWAIDDAMGEPDGFGGASNEFTELQLQQLYSEGLIE